MSRLLKILVALTGASLVVAAILFVMPVGVLALSYTTAFSKGTSLLAAVLFFIICYGISQYSQWLERRLATDHR